MHAARTTCPGCNEQVYLDELVRGRCPLCGCSLEDFEEGEEFDESFERQDLTWLVFNYFLYKRFDRMGVSPLQVMQFLGENEEHCEMDGERWGKAHFDLGVPMSPLDLLKPKRCAKCGKWFVRGGRKRISGELANLGPAVRYECGWCGAEKKE
jgi:hypothetical protein